MNPSPSSNGSALGPLLRVSDLTIGFPAQEGLALAAQGVEFGVAAGEALGIVGESGSGKSVSLRALLGVVPVPGEVVSGEAVWAGDRDLLAMSSADLREVRAKEIAMVFQDPQESLNPVYSVGDQLVEVLTKRAGQSRGRAHTKALELLERVGIPSAKERLRAYPHELSGGMRQRVMIALAIACEPTLLLADEPTTALDVTIQDQILNLLADLQAEYGMALILVSHDLGVIEQVCDRVVVMYAGRVVEVGTMDQVLLEPRHPYTAGLLAAVPSLPGEERKTGLKTIGGRPPEIGERVDGCPFAPRCPFARPACGGIDMSLDERPDRHRTACPFIEAHRSAEASDVRG